MKALVAICIPLVVAILASAQTTSGDRAGPSTVESKTVLLPSTEFESSRTENQFRKYLDGSRPKNGLLLVQAMDREESRQLVAIGFTDITYGLWRALFNDYEKEIPPFAELLQINGNVGMRLRDYRGKVITKVLEGRSPFELSACGESFSILHVSVTRTRSVANPDRTETNVHFFILSESEVQEETAKCTLGKIQEFGFADKISVSVRRDPWFIQDSDYPVVLPFLETVRPPSQEEYESGQQWRCRLHLGKPICSGREK